jgi:hypothetical protein
MAVEPAPVTSALSFAPTLAGGLSPELDGALAISVGVVVGDGVEPEPPHAVTSRAVVTAKAPNSLFAFTFWWSPLLESMT